ncbi:tetratricopeptide repeat-containing sulfotransferase family protein [Marinobacterium arenosum]|uniref:tetratricopeptide repeat-containing sulfotransferase family protein n=1 Tax=Marinobacterium arenosum TaxID=2862496 RepID=UPI001C98B71B|nr:sulfotransferase family protein [Marinobacterium arenosum]MBY4678833.1 sulfotransferase [Marinobacterium arenosum]
MPNVQDMLKLARQCEQAHQERQAEEIYRKILQLEPGQPVALHLLGRIEMRKGNLENGVACIRAAAAADPSNVSAYNDLGAIFKSRGEYTLAEAEYRKALALDDGNEPALNTVGDMLLARGNFEQAAVFLRKALAINPGNYAVANNLGVALRKAGSLQAAADAFEKAVLINPYEGSAYLNLVQIEPCLGSAQIDMVEAVLSQGSVPGQSQVYLNFALGIVYNRLQKYDQAFFRYKQGNDIQRQLIGYQHGLSLDFLRSFESCFDDTYFKARAGEAGSAESPIFIIGMPRSGSTLVEQILATHGRVYGGGETVVLDQVLSRYIDSGNFAASLTAIADVDLKVSARAYMDGLRGRFGDHEFITNKKLDNYLYLGVIALMFPNAKVIHCKRDPLDNCLSCYLNWFSTGQYFTYNMQELGEYYRAYEQLMEHWKRVLPLPMLEVQYEALVERQEAVSRQILSFCELDWDADCLQFYNNVREVHTLSDQQVRKPIYRSAVARWKHYDGHLDALRQALGLEDQSI